MQDLCQCHKIFRVCSIQEHELWASGWLITFFFIREQVRIWLISVEHVPKSYIFGPLLDKVIFAWESSYSSECAQILTRASSSHGTDSRKISWDDLKCDLVIQGWVEVQIRGRKTMIFHRIPIVFRWNFIGKSSFFNLEFEPQSAPGSPGHTWSCSKKI